MRSVYSTRTGICCLLRLVRLHCGYQQITKMMTTSLILIITKEGLMVASNKIVSTDIARDNDLLREQITVLKKKLSKVEDMYLAAVDGDMDTVEQIYMDIHYD